MSQGMLNFPLPTEEALPASETLTQRRVLAAVHTLLVAAGLVVLGSYAVLAVAHARDRYQVNFVSGVYAALGRRDWSRSLLSRSLTTAAITPARGLCSRSLCAACGTRA